MGELRKIVLDARELEHPKPLELAMQALRALDRESYLYMIHRKNPIPLLDLAKEQGFTLLSQEDSDAVWHILISKDPSVELHEYLDV